MKDRDTHSCGGKKFLLYVERENASLPFENFQICSFLYNFAVVVCCCAVDADDGGDDQKM